MPIATVLPADGSGGTVPRRPDADSAVVVPVLRYLLPLEIYGLTFDQVDAGACDVNRLVLACRRQGDRPQHADVNPAAAGSVGRLDDAPPFFTTPHRNDTCTGHRLSVATPVAPTPRIPPLRRVPTVSGEPPALTRACRVVARRAGELEGFYLSSRGAVVEEPAPVVEMRESIENQWIRTPNSQAFGNAVGGAPSVAHLPLPYAGSSYSCVVTAGTLSMAVSGSPLS